MRSRISLFAFLIAAPISLFATNPRIGVDKDPPNPIVLVSENFTFGADNLGGGFLTFENESGVNWSELSVFVNLSRLTPITCGPGPFAFCTVTTTENSPTNFSYDILFGPTKTGGVADGARFSINLNDSPDNTNPDGAGSWSPGRDFSGKANYVAPEPSAYLLTGGGFAFLIGLGLYRRRALAG